MIEVQQALRMVLENLPAARTEEVALSAALGCRLAEDVCSDMELPPFPRAMMDGFALRAGDVRRAPVELEIVGEVAAGQLPRFQINPGQAAQIMTGAPVPEGADAVQQVEKTELADGGRRVRILQAISEGKNIAPPGSEVRLGQVVLEAGRYLAPADVGVLASFGKATARVFRRPSTAVLSTGDELVEVERVPGPGEIRNINAYSLSAALRSMGLDVEYLGIARDDKADLRSKIARGLERDLLVMSGGVSMGRYDFVKEIFEEMGVKIFFEKVAMRPGKPTVFGRRRDGVVFGLPGNPVSCLVALENFIRPALWKMMGADWTPKRLRAELTREIRQKPEREAYLPAWTYWRDGRWFLDPIPHKGSADIVAFSRANSMLVFPRGAEHYAAGTQIEVVLLDEFIRK